MYYARKTQNSTRMFGLGAVLVINAVVFWMLVSGFGESIYNELTETEVAIIEVPEIEEEEPPPPPPVEVDLPPPPPQVILPDFVFDQPPPENAIRQVEITPTPQRPVEVRPPPPAVVMKSKPKTGRRFEKPEYPAQSIRAKESGEVTVSVCVDATGKMTDVKLIKSSGFPRLDDATVKGLPRTRLDPALGSDGKPMASCSPPHVMTIVWNLEEVKG